MKSLFDSDEAARREAYGARVGAAYARTSEVSAIDPQGSNLAIDLMPLLAAPCHELQFTAVGCQGTLTAALGRVEGASQIPGVLARKLIGKQRSVGTAWTSWHAAKQEARVPTFGFLLGDNFYESGLPKTDPAVVDAMFDEGYYRVYNEHDGKPLGIPHFGLLGNHDYNFHGHAVVPREGSDRASSMARALAEVEYGYRVGKGWHMPYRHYLVVSPVADFFVIDTSTFLFDPEQQAWVRAMHARLRDNGKWKFLMGHHGYVTFGKRGAMAQQSAPVLGQDDDFHRHIFRWFVDADLHFHVNVVAHDHFSAAALLTYDAHGGGQRRTYYVLAGGGGAALGEAHRDALARLGSSLARIDLLEKSHGFATFRVTRTQLELGFRLQRRRRWESAMQRPLMLELDRPGFWTS